MTTDLLLGRGELAPRTRLAWLALGYLIYVLAGPGMLCATGSPLGALGLVFWALTASRPGPKKARIEWLCGAIAFSCQTAWMGLVFWAAMPFIFIGWGLWALYPGALLMRLARRLPLSIATPLAWTGFEALLTWVKTPVGLSWLRLGHYMNDWPELAGSARVWGDLGLGFVMAAVAGLIADLWRVRVRVRVRVRGRGRGRGRGRCPTRASWASTRASWAGGLVPLSLAALFAFISSAPATRPGPRLLLVQPSFEQKRKQVTGSPKQLLAESYELTASALAENRAAGGAEPDLVAWGESMLFTTYMEDGLEGLIAQLEADPWTPWAELDASARERLVRDWRDIEQSVITNLVGDGARRIPRILPEGCAFISGVNGVVAHEGRVRDVVGAGLWSPDGARAGLGTKVHLAPGGETMVGLERLEFVRDIIYSLANYVPDLLAAEETATLELQGRGGERWDFGLSICFDNAYADPYAGPLRRGPLDFHLVISNEAWYERSQELDQMVAFSRLLALSTGRCLVRVANSGISAAFGPDGRELDRLRVDGDDRMVRGALFVDVPVPIEATSSVVTPFITVEPWLLPLGSLLPLLFLLFAGAGCVTPAGPVSSGAQSDREDEHP